MNFHQKGLRTVLLAALLATSAAPASAAESPGSRAATAVGHWIAAQGNQALRDIRQELRERLLDNLKPLLPATPPAPPAAADSTATAR